MEPSLTFSKRLLPGYYAQETMGDSARESEQASAQTRPLNWEEGRRGPCHAQGTPFSWKPPWCLGTPLLVLFKAITETGVSMTREVTHAGTSTQAEVLTLRWAESEQWPCLCFQACFLLGGQAHPIIESSRWPVPWSSIRNVSKAVSKPFYFPLAPPGMMNSTILPASV